MFVTIVDLVNNYLKMKTELKNIEFESSYAEKTTIKSHFSASEVRQSLYKPSLTINLGHIWYQNVRTNASYNSYLSSIAI